MDKEGSASCAITPFKRIPGAEEERENETRQQQGKALPSSAHGGHGTHQGEPGDGENEGKGGLQQQSSPLARLMERTGYSIVQQNGQRRYGPPPSWDGQPPPRGCEVFVGKIPRDCFEDELVPVFERTGKLYEMRLMMDYNGQNRGYAFVVYTATADAKECVKMLNNYEIRKVRR